MTDKIVDGLANSMRMEVDPADMREEAFATMPEDKPKPKPYYLTREQLRAEYQKGHADPTFARLAETRLRTLGDANAQ